MTHKCAIILLIITSSLLIIFFSLLILLSTLLDKLEEHSTAIAEMHQVLSDLQIEKIEYVQD